VTGKDHSGLKAGSDSSLLSVTRETIATGGVLLFFYSASAFLIYPFGNHPFHDDWTYAWSVENLLNSGDLRFLDWSIHYPVTQILWGTLFSLPFGFSFSALRVSTVVLAWLGAMAFYGTLRELGRTRTESLTATLVLIGNPVVFVLSFSFMTDVPFLSVANISFFFLVRAVLQKSSLQLWVGCVFAASAFLIRQIAIAIPLSLILYALLTPSYRSWKYILPPLTVSIVLALIPLLFAQIFGLTSQYSGRTWVFDYWLHHYEHALPGILGTLIHVGLALIPIAIALSSFYRLRLFWSNIAALLLLTGYSYFYSGQIPQPLEGMWRLNTLGNERHLLRGIPDRDFLPFWWNYPLLAISLISLAAVTAKLCELIRAHNATRFDLFGWYALIQLALMMALWLFGSDRYSIVLLPPLILLTAGGYLRTTIAIPGAAILYAVALLVTWNATQTRRAIGDAVAWLRQKYRSCRYRCGICIQWVEPLCSSRKSTSWAMCPRETFLLSRQER
jgi:hypothetical protein